MVQVVRARVAPEPPVVAEPVDLALALDYYVREIREPEHILVAVVVLYRPGVDVLGGPQLPVDPDRQLRDVADPDRVHAVDHSARDVEDVLGAVQSDKRFDHRLRVARAEADILEAVNSAVVAEGDELVLGGDDEECEEEGEGAHDGESHFPSARSLSHSSGILPNRNGRRDSPMKNNNYRLINNSFARYDDNNSSNLVVPFCFLSTESDESFHFMHPQSDP